MHEFKNVTSLDLIQCVAEHLLRMRIDIKDFPVAIQKYENFRNMPNHGSAKGLELGSVVIEIVTRLRHNGYLPFRAATCSIAFCYRSISLDCGLQCRGCS